MKLETSIWQTYFAIKLTYMFLALFVFTQFTSLGDTGRYLNAEPFEFVWSLNSSNLMDFLVGSLVSIFGKVAANVPFIFISFFGVYYPIKKLSLNKNQLIIILSLLSFPSFGIWTSIASKEAFAVLYMGLVLGFIIDLIKDNSSKNYFLLFIGLFLCWIFKSQYLISIIAVITFIILHNKLKLSKYEYGSTINFIFIIFISLFFLFIFRNEINQLSFEVVRHFSFESNSTRENNIWIEKYDVFWNAPYGMLVAFVGPTLNEALNKVTHMIVFLESLIIISLFLYTSLKLILFSINAGKLNVYYLGIFIIILSWLLFLHYPMGILNPGSAIRYRQGFYPFLVILYFFLYTDILNKYKSIRVK